MGQGARERKPTLQRRRGLRRRAVGGLHVRGLHRRALSRRQVLGVHGVGHLRVQEVVLGRAANEPGTRKEAIETRLPIPGTVRGRARTQRAYASAPRTTARRLGAARLAHAPGRPPARAKEVSGPQWRGIAHSRAAGERLRATWERSQRAPTGANPETLTYQERARASPRLQLESRSEPCNRSRRKHQPCGGLARHALLATMTPEGKRVTRSFCVSAHVCVHCFPTFEPSQCERVFHVLQRRQRGADQKAAS